MSDEVHGGEASPDGRLYLPELDGMRVAAFGLIFLFHGGASGPFLARWLGHDGARSVRENGWVGVQLFFVLSGYLITTLLLREERRFGRIDLKAFFVRRALRIWPLYYLTVLLTFVVVPMCLHGLGAAGDWENARRHLPAFLVFLGNWSMIARGTVATDAQSILWSVCVEEQFYLVVPWLVAGLRGRARLAVVACLMGVSVVARAWLACAHAHQMSIQYNTLAQFDTLLGGAFLALMLGPEPRDRGSVGRALAWIQWPVYAAALWLFSRGALGHGLPWRRTWDFVAIWGIAAALVAIAVTVPGWLRGVFSTPVLVRLGRISYGLYMYHEIGFLLRQRFADDVGWFPFDDALLPAIAFGITVVLAMASYRFVERPFLRLKAAWTRVPSRPV